MAVRYRKNVAFKKLAFLGNARTWLYKSSLCDINDEMTARICGNQKDSFELASLPQIAWSCQQESTIVSDLCEQKWITLKTLRTILVKVKHETS